MTVFAPAHASVAERIGMWITPLPAAPASKVFLVAFSAFVVCGVSYWLSFYRLCRLIPERDPDLHMRLGAPRLADVFLPWPFGNTTLQGNLHRFITTRRFGDSIDSSIRTARRLAWISLLLIIASWIAMAIAVCCWGD